MNRLGFIPAEMPAVMERLKSHRAVNEVTLMSHFAQADEAAGIATQLEVFNRLAAPYRVPRSLANSATILRYPAAHGDWVRPGIMLYGSSPFADVSAQQLGLQPAETLSSEIISVRKCSRRGCRLWSDFPCRFRDAHRHRRLRLRRWLSAPCADRYAHPRQRAAHAHARPDLDGYAGCRSDRHPGGASGRPGRVMG